MYIQKLIGASIGMIIVAWVVSRWCCQGVHGKPKCAGRHESLCARSAADLVSVGVSRAGATWMDATSWVLACVCMVA